MKKIGLLVLYIITFGQLFGQQVFINPSELTVNPGEQFTTTLEIADVVNLGSFEVYLSFNPDYLNAQLVELGDFLGSTGRTIFPLTNEIDNVEGNIDFAVTTLGSDPPGPDGDGVLLVIDWIANESLDFEVITELIIDNIQVTEPNGTIIPTELFGSIITINGPMNTSLIFSAACPGEIQIPIEVIGFEEITNFELFIEAPDNISFVGFENSDIANIIVEENGGVVSLNYDGDAANLDGVHLIDLVFYVETEFAGEIFDIIWLENDCHYYTDNGEVSSNYEDGQISAELLPGDAINIIGIDSICIGMEGVVYETTEIENAAIYIWSLEPENAGEITSNELECSVDFYEEFTGNAVISVFGENNCGNGSSYNFDLLILPEPTVTLGPNDTICENQVYEIEGQAGNYSSLLWSSSGDGYFDEPNQLLTNYIPGENDILNEAVILRLYANPLSPCAQIAKDSLLLSFSYLINEVSIPTGPTEVDISYTPTSNYYCDSENANQFDWYLTPPIAGMIEAQDEQASVEWNPSFSGEVKLSVMASNNCNEIYSDSLTINVENTVGVFHQDNMDFQVSPNPSKGKFILKTQQKLYLEDISIYSIDGRRIMFEMESLSNEYILSLEDHCKGSYLLQIKTYEYSQTIRIEVF